MTSLLTDGTTDSDHEGDFAVDAAVRWLAGLALEQRPRPIVPALCAQFGITIAEAVIAVRAADDETKTKYGWCKAMYSRFDVPDELKVMVGVLTDRFVERDGGVCSLKMRLLGEAAGKSERTAHRLCNRLEKLGFIHIERSKGRNPSEIWWISTVPTRAVEDRSNPDTIVAGFEEVLNPATDVPNGRVNPATTVAEHNTLENTLVGGPALQAGPTSDVGAVKKVVERPQAPKDRNGSNPFHDSNHEDAPDAALLAAGAHDASIAFEEEDLSWFDLEPIEDTSAFGRYRDCHGGECPTLLQLQTFVAENGGEITEYDLREVEDVEAERLADAQAQLRAGRSVDSLRRPIEVPESDGSAVRMTENALRRAHYVGRVCDAAERRPPGEARRSIWMQAVADLRLHLAQDGLEPGVAEARILALSSEVSEEIRRREKEFARRQKEMVS